MEGTGYEHRQFDLRLVLRVALAAFGLVVLVALAYSLPALFGAVLRELRVP